MFPTLVWKVQLKAELHESIDAMILAALERMRRDAPQLAPGRDGSQFKHCTSSKNFGISFLASITRRRVFCGS